MGVERSVTRWYLRRQLLLTEIARLEAQLAPSSVSMTDEEPVEDGDDAKVDLTNTNLRLAMVQEELKALGHCPKPMMG
jgi:hypothetical protein